MNRAELTKYERERLIRLVKASVQGEFWKIIANQIKGQIESENAYLDSFKKSVLRETDRDLYNQATGRLFALKKCLEIPEIFVREHTTILERIGRKAAEQTEKVFSYLRS